LPCYTVGKEPEPPEPEPPELELLELELPELEPPELELHQKFYPEPEPHKNDAAPQHWILYDFYC
jgi:hypothetical protein